jgi:hypothetical protein
MIAGELSKVDKGKLKKWKKRVENGEIQDTALYASAFGQFGLAVCIISDQYFLPLLHQYFYRQLYGANFI